MTEEPLKLIGFSDVHIGPRDSATDEHGENLGFVSNRHCRQAVTDYAKLNKPDYFLFAGDLYKSAIGRPTQTEQWEATKFFRDLSLIAPVHAKPGNHDVDGIKYGVHALQIFDAMNMRMVVHPVEGWTVLDLDGVKVGMFHGMISGAMLESGMRSDDVAPGCPSPTLAPPADLWVLGDIHKRQFLRKNMAYCGALDRLNFGEEDESPSFWWIEIDRATHEVTWKAIPTPARKYVTVTLEEDVGTVDVTGAVTRFVGELRTMNDAEVKATLLKRGALEVSSIYDTSEYSESPTLYTGFKPAEAFSIWVEAQEHVTKSDGKFAQALLDEMLK